MARFIIYPLYSMSQLCDCAKFIKINVSAVYGADALWCAVCHLNLDLEDFTLSDTLANDLFRWSNRFDEWLDLDTNTVIEVGSDLETKHNKEGRFLTKGFQNELT